MAPIEKRVSCSSCGMMMQSENEICPVCGSNGHLISTVILEPMEIRQSILMKLKNTTKHGKAKERRKIKIEEDKHGYRYMDVNVDKDSYFEEVRSKQSGEVIHYCFEPLSQHRGHGSAKEKK